MGRNVVNTRKFHCEICGYEWKELTGAGRPDKCPACAADDISRVDSLAGHSHKRREGRGGRGGNRNTAGGNMGRSEPERLGPVGHCVCPKCGSRTSHQRGIPCQEETCPKCGSRLLREGSSHYRAWQKRKTTRKQ